MPVSLPLPRAAAVFGVALTALFAMAPPALSQASRRISGVFTEVSDRSVRIQPEAGAAVTVMLAAPFTVARLDKGKPDDLKPGAFVGVGARPQPDGSQKAVQIVIFPEAMRGTGEGHRAWGVMPETTMTNATIAETVQSVEGPNFTLTYKGGTQKVVTPAGASILLLGPATRGDLKPGVRGQLVASEAADGSLSAARVTLWGDGVTPY